MSAVLEETLKQREYAHLGFGYSKLHGYTILTERAGLICRGMIYSPVGEALFGITNTFTQRGVRKTLEYYVTRLADGATVREIEQEHESAKEGW